MHALAEHRRTAADPGRHELRHCNRQVAAERDALAVASPKAVETPAVLLMNLKGVGPETATLLWLEGAPGVRVEDAPADELLGEVGGGLVVDDRKRAQVLVVVGVAQMQRLARDAQAG